MYIYLTMHSNKTNKTIMLYGTCAFEIIGLHALLSTFGYEKITMTDTNQIDVIMVALSSELLNGWGRHLAEILALKKKTRKKVIILIPKRLKRVSFLKFFGFVSDGKLPIDMFKGKLKHLFDKFNDRDFGKGIDLTVDQRMILTNICKKNYGSKFVKTFISTGSYHRTKLVETLGFKNTHELKLFFSF